MLLRDYNRFYEDYYGWDVSNSEWVKNLVPNATVLSGTFKNESMPLYEMCLQQMEFNPFLVSLQCTRSCDSFCCAMTQKEAPYQGSSILDKFVKHNCDPNRFLFLINYPEHGILL
jgi:hypothetical protein